MSWGVTKSGSRAEVKAAIDQALTVKPPFSGDQVLEFERARVALHSAVDSLRPADTHASLSAFGSYDSVRVELSGWVVTEVKPAEPVAGDDVTDKGASA